MAFEKLSAFTKDVSDLADKPSLTPTELKAQFDAAPDEVRQYLNKLIDALVKTASGDSGAKNIGVTTITGLTGTDVQTLLEAINTKFDSSGITVIGSNSNGTYIRYNNGVQMCWMRTTVTNQAISDAYGSLFQGVRTWTFPAAFISAPTVQCSEFRWGTGASWGTVGDTPTTASVVLRGMDVSSRATGTSTDISATAVGKWK
jgi:hypothetical protein